MCDLQLSEVHAAVLGGAAVAGPAEAVLAAGHGDDAGADGEGVRRSVGRLEDIEVPDPGALGVGTGVEDEDLFLLVVVLTRCLLIVVSYSPNNNRRHVVCYC